MNHIQFVAAAAHPEVSLPAEKVFTLGSVTITNSLLLGALGFVIVFAMLAYTAWVIRSGRKRTFLAKLIEWTYEGLYKTVEGIVGDEKIARTLAPLPITLFFFILVQYYLGVLPIVGPITYHGHPVFRSFVSDLNTTFGLAIVTMITAEVYALKVHGFFGSAKRYVRNPVKDPAGAFEGLLEVIAQISRGIALSMRLFGNVFAGEVLLIMIAFLAQYVASVALPLFYLFELFIGGIQAYIFFMLTTIFISLGMATHASHDEPHDSIHPSAGNAPQAPDRG